MRTRALTMVLGAAAIAALLLTSGTALSSAAAEGCQPQIPLVDPAATEPARCVGATLDSWKRAGVMGVGQQLDVQEESRATAPLAALGSLRPAVVGFDFGEMATAHRHFAYDPIPYLTGLAASGIVLTATWHVDNPATGGRYDDRRWTNISELLDPTTPAYGPFWASFDELLANARRLQEANVAVIFKPLHEASGGWFWWGKPDPTDFKRLYSSLQQRAYDSGVHNLLWAYAANPQAWSTDNDPLALLPAAVDLVGLDEYDDVLDRPRNVIRLTDFRRLAARAPRMALTEVGPRDSLAGWGPRAITSTLRRERLYAAYAMLWRDDPQPGNRYQIASMAGGLGWLATCPAGLCDIRPKSRS